MIALTSMALFVHIFFNDIMRNYAPFYVNADCAVCFSIAFFYVRLAALEITADQRSMIARILSLIG